MIGMILGDYEILTLIGTGGMAKVFEAEHTETGEKVAIKTLPEEFYEDATYRIRFQREIEAVSRLDHPNILPLITYGEADQISYMVMPYMSHGTLRDKLKQGRLLIEDCLRLYKSVEFSHRSCS